ncbi:MAG: murein biosynthesis integral membrane protein MurJ [Candidatus Doudnabacteria bacterium]|nr:murein biosynthesis integral membrane protein MurJ [Candidatus Doudnabacteria bacterium]
MINNIRKWENNFSISKATFIVGFLTLLSRLIGLLRDRLFASNFGAGDTLDIYYAAFRIPDLVFNLLILGTLSVAFIPIFTELLLNDRPRAYKNANAVLNSTILLMSAICLILFFFATPLTKLMVPGFSGEKLLSTIALTKILLFSPIIFTLSNVFSSILNAQKRFIAVGLAPILYNFGIIGGLIFLYPRFGLKGLGYGVILGALMHLLVQIPEAIRLGFKWQFIIDFKDRAFRKMGKLFIPRIFGVDNSQISLLIGSIIGSILASGSITVFNLANNLQAVPIGIFAISASIAAFPLLSENFSQKKETGFLSALNKTISQILYFIIPISIWILLLRAQIVRLVFGAGKFDWQDTILTFNTLGIFSLALVSQSLSPLFSRAFYARQNTIIPVIINFFTMALNAVLAFILGKKMGITGVAAGFAVSSLLNAATLYVVLKTLMAKSNSFAEKTELALLDNNLMIEIAKMVLSSLFAGLATYACLYLIEPLINTHKVLGLLTQTAFAFSVGVVIYLATTYKLNLDQTKKTLRFLRNLF